MKILIGADIVPTAKNIKYFEENEIYNIINDDLYDILNEADYRIFNLETPLSNKLTPISKNGPCLSASTKSARGLKGLNVDFVTIANNHILDQGVEGLYSTISELEKNKICFAGAGKNLENAIKPFVLIKDGIKIGIYCCAEHEFTIANQFSAGANPFDCLESLDHIVNLKEKCDYVIILYHGGKEHYRYPSPNLQKRCRKMVEKGADLVVCQHSHCIGCEENWNNGKIIYGQGNFIFLDEVNEFWATSLLVMLDINKNENKISYIPLVNDGVRTKLAIKNEKDEILKMFYSRSKEITNEIIVFEKYKEFAKSEENYYLGEFCGKKTTKIFYRMFNKLSHYQFGKLMFNMNFPIMLRNKLLNHIECEAHRELIIEILKNGKNKKK
ncbi:MAG: CapA family protein [Bacilli bacterium]